MSWHSVLDMVASDPARRPRRSRGGGEDGGFDPRRLLRSFYKVAMTLVTLGFVAGALLAWLAATPGNGLLLVSLILGWAALMTGLSIGKYDRQDYAAETYREIVDEIASTVQVATSLAEPEVRVMDGDAVARAKRMARDGKPLDEICRAVEPGYAAWSAPMQRAFQEVMRQVIDRA